MKLRFAFAAFFALLMLTTLCVRSAFAQRSCESLTSLTLANVTITSATSIPAGPYNPLPDTNQPPPLLNFPAFCRVNGIAKPTSDSEIRFELWMPASGWNRKFEQVGNGGYAGAIPLASMVVPLLRGYATAGTDDGHVGATDVSWAIGHPEKVIDYGYRAVHETSATAKAIVREFYGKDSAQSYFVGCSDGGREALMEAQRFPADFNGILSGAPANFWTRIVFKIESDERAVHDSPASFIPPAKLPALQKAAIAACDTLDGVKDGLIENPRRCHFDPALIQCKGDDNPDCLTASQVETARKIYGPVKNPRTGTEISPGYEPGAEALPLNWAPWITGVAFDRPGLGAFYANAFFSNLLYGDPKWDPHTLNFDATVKAADDKLAPVLNASDPNLSPFKARGGKLIQYHGWSDAAVPPESSVDYFESVQKKMGNTENFYRLFMAPGMSHCFGGLGATAFVNTPKPQQADAAHDLVLALDQWVAQGVAPDKVIATGFVDGKPDKGIAITRPLCPYPKEAHYEGNGDTNSADNFTCKVPAKNNAK